MSRLGAIGRARAGASLVAVLGGLLVRVAGG
jgi:hypothetical protein